MNPLDYCLQQAAPTGSPVYYALRYASPVQRALFAPLYALRQECEDTVTQAGEPAVAQTKLAWWEQEIASAAGQASAPSHPITQALAAVPGNWLPRLAPLLIAVVGAYREDLEKARYLDFDALQRQLRASSGRITGMLAYCAEKVGTAEAPTSTSATDTLSAAGSAALDDSDLPDWAIALGAATRLAQLTALIGDHARHGRIYLPVNDMQSHEVPASDVLNRRYTPAMQTLLQEQAARSRTCLLDARSAARAALPRARRRRQRPLLAEAAMAQRLLDEIIRDGVPVLHQKIALTPVRNLLVSWWATL